MNPSTATAATNSDWATTAMGLVEKYLYPFGLKLLGALALWIIGRIIAAAVRRVVRKGLDSRRLDGTLVRYIDSMLGVIFTLVILLGVLSIFGIETTSVAGLLAAAGVAIGMAWSGLLSNFAGGVFLVILRPFKVGDMITAGGVTGDVREIGLFVTTIDQPDNVRTFVGNAKIFSDTIVNYTTNPYRRVELKAQLDNTVDPADAIRRLQEALRKIPNVIDKPEPSVEVLDFTLAGPVLAVRPFCHNNHYWDVYFATNATIRNVCAEAGYPPPAVVQIEKHISLDGSAKPGRSAAS